ncbi:S9 family peptidase [Arthrobacter subterraneus]|nr:S9 family peptidase [Arthrobacter subterraneus]
MNTVSAPSLHPDTRRCVVSVTRPDYDADAYVGQLWEVPLDGGAPRRLTRGFRDTAPKFSPDGSILAFLRAGEGGKPQVYITDGRGGEPQQLTDRPLGVSSFEWSPDSRRLVLSARVPEDGRYGTVDGVSAGQEDPRLVSSFKYRMNGVGYTRDKRSQLFLLDVPSLGEEPFVRPVGRAARSLGEDAPTAFAEPAQLTDADADHTAPRFSFDGSRILFSASLEPDSEANLRSDIYSIALDGTDRQRLSNFTENLVSCGNPVHSADGRWLYYLGSALSPSGVDFVARNTALYIAPVDDPTQARVLTDPESLDLGEIGEVVPAGGDSVLVFNRSRGAGDLRRVDAQGAVEVLADGELIVTGAAGINGTVVVSYTDPDTVGDVARVDGRALTRLTDFSAALRSETAVIPPREEIFTAPDGYPVHGWVLIPEGEGPHPVLLNIHGGPYAQYGWGYFDEAQVYLDAGYAVLMCNPRGAAGYGEEHGRVIKEAMGTVDMQDVLAFLEGAVRTYDQLDGDRLGVMGGSYGGYLTAWLIANDHRFQGAIVERGFLDPESFIGSSDIGWFFSEAYTGAEPEKVQAQSPYAQVHRVRTPTFVIHSEEDLRCPLEQAQRYYTALKRHGVECEMLIFPGETHELSRTGTPWHRRQRFEHILRWWAEKLPSKKNQPA